VLIEGEDLRLVLLAPFSLFGYKQFQDAVLLRSLGALRPGRQNEWLKPTRVRQRATEEPAKATVTEADGSGDERAVDAGREERC
jgi:hypothetical protein